MSRLPCQTIRSHVPQLITPFHERTVRNGKTFGLGPAGYDVRIAQTVRMNDRNRFALASTIEQFNVPADMMADVKDKSSWIRMGLIQGNTTLEPGWRGYLTLELIFVGVAPIIIHAGDAIAQIVFERLEAPTEMPYAGKYQDQEAGPQPARSEPDRPPVARHSWSVPVRSQHRTIRSCAKCGIAKVTHHEGDGFPWVTFVRNGATVSSDATPPCDGGSA